MMMSVMKMEVVEQPLVKGQNVNPALWVGGGRGVWILEKKYSDMGA